MERGRHHKVIVTILVGAWYELGRDSGDNKEGMGVRDILELESAGQGARLNKYAEQKTENKDNDKVSMVLCEAQSSEKHVTQD
mgnify:CR=1 FL=1